LDLESYCILQGWVNCGVQAGSDPLRHFDRLTRVYWSFTANGPWTVSCCLRSWILCVTYCCKNLEFHSLWLTSDDFLILAVCLSRSVILNMHHLTTWWNSLAYFMDAFSQSLPFHRNLVLGWGLVMHVVMWVGDWLWNCCRNTGNERTDTQLSGSQRWGLWVRSTRLTK